MIDYIFRFKYNFKNPKLKKYGGFVWKIGWGRFICIKGYTEKSIWRYHQRLRSIYGLHDKVGVLQTKTAKGFLLRPIQCLYPL